MTVRKIGEWQQILTYGDMGFPLAYSHINKLVSLEEKGRGFVEDLYEVFLAQLDVPDEDYADFEAVLDKHIELHPENTPPPEELDNPV